MTMIGIDPHKATHTVVAIDDAEGVIDVVTLSASPGQADRLVAWADGFTDRVWAVEAANGLGRLVARQLVARGETVFDVPPVLASRVRLMGSGRSQKSDQNDARSVAVAALRSDHLARVTPDDAVTVMRLLVKRHRDLAQSKAKAANRLHALLIELVPGGISVKISATNASELLDGIVAGDEPTRIRVLVAREIITDMRRLDEALKTSKQRIRKAVIVADTTLTQIPGIGPIGAATIIGYTTDITRFPTKGHYATYNGTAPIEASSGARTRHRLNPRGNRIINHAIHIAAVTQLRHDTNGRAYYDKKIDEGKTSKEAIRALKRRISDAIYRQLTIDAATTKEGPGGQPGTTLQRLRGQLDILNDWLFGSVTPEPSPQTYNPPTGQDQPERSHAAPKPPLDTKRLRYRRMPMSTLSIARETMGLDAPDCVWQFEKEYVGVHK